MAGKVAAVAGLALLPSAVMGYVCAILSFSDLPPWGINWELGIKSGALTYIVLLVLAVPPVFIVHPWRRKASAGN